MTIINKKREGYYYIYPLIHQGDCNLSFSLTPDLSYQPISIVNQSGWFKHISKSNVRQRKKHCVRIRTEKIMSGGVKLFSWVKGGAALHGISILCFFCSTAHCPGSLAVRCSNLGERAGCAIGAWDLGGLHSLCQETGKKEEREETQVKV